MAKLRHQYLRPSVDEQLPKPRNRDSKAGAGRADARFQMQLVARLLFLAESRMLLVSHAGVHQE